ncbi:MAG: TIGR03435 family protein [Acidobacteriaceae bacterium]
MSVARHLAAAFALLILAGPAFTGYAQTAQPKPELLLFHPSGPPLSYEVATIKPIDSNTADRMVKLPPGFTLSPLSIRRYIMDAYGATYQAQIVGGPDWLNKDSYDIKGKVPDDLEAAFQNMTREDRINQNSAMQQSLLADRFHLKAHFETRVLPVYELVPAKGGLKITEVPAPPQRKPGASPSMPLPGNPPSPGTMVTRMSSNGIFVLNGRAIQMHSLAHTINFAGATEVGDRPIVDHSGFTGYFDVKNLTWAPLGNADATSTPDAPSLSEALQDKLGLKLVSAKDPIEVLVIDSIDRPSPN